MTVSFDVDDQRITADFVEDILCATPSRRSNAAVTGLARFRSDRPPARSPQPTACQNSSRIAKLPTGPRGIAVASTRMDQPLRAT
jgi:hypothetical protein